MTPETPKAPILDDPLLTVGQVAEALEVKPRTVMQWLKEGRLKGFKLAKKSWRIRKSGLETFIKQWEQSG